MSTRTLDLAIAALKTSLADLVAQEDQRVNISKGKSRASQADETRDAEYRRQLEEHSSALDELLATREKQNEDAVAKASQTVVSQPLNHEFPDSKVANPAQDAIDKDPYLNPFTGSYVFPETGFEPGPSSSNRVQDGGADFLFPPPAYSLDDNLDLTTTQDHNLQISQQEDHANDELDDTQRSDGHRGQEAGESDSNPNPGKANYKPSIFRGIGSMVAAFESWITPKKKTAVHGSSSPPENRSVSKAPQPRDISSSPLPVETKDRETIEKKTSSAADSCSEDVANNSFLGDLAEAAQMQKNREMADQEAAAGAQKSYEQLVQMQREFDEECTRLRADREMALAYARDMEEAMRVDQNLRGEEAILVQDLEVAKQLEIQFRREEAYRKQDMETAARLAKGLEEADAVLEADTAFAMRLMDEEKLALQNDHAFAERLQAEVEQQEAQAAKFYDSNSNYDPSRTHAGELDSQPLPYARFPSLENIRGSAMVNSNNRLNANPEQQPKMATPSDRTFAQAAFAEEQIRYAEANEKWKRNIQAWSDTNRMETEVAAAEHRRGEKGQGQARRMPTERPEVIAARISVEKDVANCALCIESLPKTHLVRPCKDFYCRSCLADWFQRALQEKPKKQPRCCNQILPVSLVSRQLGDKFMASWRLFELEATTPNPLYCSNRRCAKFIPPYDIHGDTGSCSCASRTCRHCRNRSHPGKLCAEDEDTQKVKALGKRQGWRYCPKCKHLIERTEGCLHMVCSQCRTDFCWKCGKTTCKGSGACKGGMEYYQ